MLTSPPWARVGAPPLWLLVMATASGTLSLHILVPALPLVARDLGAAEAAVQQTVTQYVIGLAIGQLIYGPLSDRFGRRPVLLGGLVLYTIGGLVAWFSPNVWLLVAARILQALGGCGGLVLGRAIQRDVAEPAEAASRLALLTLIVALGPALAPLVGSWLAVAFGWRAILALTTLLGAATVLAAILLLPETHTARRRGAGLLRAYLPLLRNPGFLGYAVGGACTTTSFYAYIAASPFIFIDMLNRPVTEAGASYIVVFGGVSLGAFIGNRLMRRVAPIPLLNAGSTIAILGAALLFAAAVTGALSVATVLVPMLVVTVGFGIASALALTGALSAAPKAIGAASGLYGFMQMAVGALCTMLVGIWPADHAVAASSVMLIAMLLGRGALTVATRRGFGTGG